MISLDNIYWGATIIIQRLVHGLEWPTIYAFAKVSCCCLFHSLNWHIIKRMSSFSRQCIQYFFFFHDKITHAWYKRRPSHIDSHTVSPPHVLFTTCRWHHDRWLMTSQYITRYDGVDASMFKSGMWLDINYVVAISTGFRVRIYDAFFKATIMKYISVCCYQ